MKINRNHWIAMKNDGNKLKSMNINETNGNQWKSREMNRNQLKSMEINGNQWKSMETMEFNVNQWKSLIII